MSALTKVIEIPFEDDEDEESSEEESTEEEWDELEYTSGRVSRCEKDLEDVLTQFSGLCEDTHEVLMAQLKEGTIRNWEQVLYAYVALWSTLHDGVRIQKAHALMSDIAQLDSDLACAKQKEYQIRFGS